MSRKVFKELYLRKCNINYIYAMRVKEIRGY